MRLKRESRIVWDDVFGIGGLTFAGGVIGGPLGAMAGAALGAKLAGGAAVIPETQMAQQHRDVIAEELAVFEQGANVRSSKTLPAIADIPLMDRAQWVSVPDVICVFIDMKDSTKLAARAGSQKVARAFQLYTSTAVRLLNAFNAPYIDVRGDGAFALFDAGQHYRALVAALTFKTFAYRIAVPAIEARCGVKVGSHIGIDQKGVLVRRIGYRRTQERDDRQNEVWAGQPVNMAAKLAGMSGDDELLVSQRYYDRIADDRARRSCSCDGKPQSLWSAVDLSKDGKFDFSKGYKLTSCLCLIHGKSDAEYLLSLSPDAR